MERRELRERVVELSGERGKKKGEVERVGETGNEGESGRSGERGKKTGEVGRVGETSDKQEKMKWRERKEKTGG